jgi:hypothetical protein
MMTGARAHARWEIQMAGNLLASRKRVLVLLLLTIPIVMGGLVFADQMGSALPDILGGKKPTVRPFIPPAFSSFPFSSDWGPA